MTNTFDGELLLHLAAFYVQCDECRALFRGMLVRRSAYNSAWHFSYQRSLCR